MVTRVKNTYMARNKATTTDIHARLARSECANYRNNKCHGTTPCLVVNGEACGYFTTYVQPLLDYPEVAAKYHNEAKISVALNPKSKIVRKRRQASEPKLAIETTPPAPVIIKTPPIKKTSVSQVEQQPAPAATPPEPASAPLSINSVTTPVAAIPEEEQLFLELTPYEPTKRKSVRRR